MNVVTDRPCQAFAALPLFAPLQPEQLQVLQSHTRVRRFERGDYLVTSGDTSRSMYVLTSGRARVFRRNDAGHELTLALLDAGECFGELALLAGTPRSADVVALEPCRALQIPHEAVVEALAANPGAALAMIQHLVDQVLTLTNELHGLALDGVYPRLRRLLLCHADRLTSPPSVRGFTHREMATMIGASREMVSRLLADLRAGGYVRTAHREITLERDLPEAW